ncbi:MAG: hypothetical protein ACRDZ6_01780 [Acidimicrobiales bacterium]
MTAPGAFGVGSGGVTGGGTGALRRWRRPAIGRIVLAALACSAGLGLALGLGAPKPGVAERSYAAAMGILGWALAVVLLRGGGGAGTDTGRFDSRQFAGLTGGGRGGRGGSGDGSGGGGSGDDRGDAASYDPVEASRARLESCLRLGTVTSGDFHALVRPRLTELSAARLQRHGIASGSALAADLLGPAAALVDPRRAPPEDRTARGTELDAVAELVDRLESLG